MAAPARRSMLPVNSRCADQPDGNYKTVDAISFMATISPARRDSHTSGHRSLSTIPHPELDFSAVD
jgi:hypothetical protein